MISFTAFLKKEFFHIIRDKRTLMILFGMPITLVIIFGFAITTELKNANIAILDKSNDSYSSMLINKISNSSYFTVNQYLRSDNEVEKYLRSGKGKAVFSIDKDFQKSIERNENVNISIITDAVDPNNANTIRMYLTYILIDFQSKEIFISSNQIGITTITRMLYNPKLEGAYYFVPGVITVILMLVSAMMTSVTIAREKELGTMEILLVSPLNPSVIILGKSIPYIFLAMINAITVLIIGYTVFNMPLAGNILLLLGECLLFVLCALSIGILISTFVASQQLALLISIIGLLMPTMLLSGFIYPIDGMPVILQIISNIIPAKYFITIIKNIMIKGVGVEFVWKETIILLGMTLVFMALSINKFKLRLN